MLWQGQMPTRRQSSALALFVILLSLGCNETPADLRPWRPSDHDHTENPNADQVQVRDAGAAGPGHGLDDVTVVAWQQNCTSCHGPLGRGDGPQGQLLHASDLSRPDWQASVSDEAIAATIRQGRGRMPAFNLPEVTITRLVALVRMLDLNRMRQATGAAQAHDNGAASAQPASPKASSATPTPSRVGR